AYLARVEAPNRLLIEAIILPYHVEAHRGEGITHLQADIGPSTQELLPNSEVRHRKRADAAIFDVHGRSIEVRHLQIETLARLYGRVCPRRPSPCVVGQIGLHV